MSKALLAYLVRLFAFIASMYPLLLYENAKDFLTFFILKEFSPDISYENLRLFNEYYQEFVNADRSADDSDSIMSQLAKEVQYIDPDIPYKQKFQILIRLLFFEKFLLKYENFDGTRQIDFSHVLRTVVSSYQIDDQEYLNCRQFIAESLFNIPDQSKLLIVGGKKLYELNIDFMQRSQLYGQLFFLYVKSAHLLLFYYKGSDLLTLNEQPLYPNHTYLFQKGFSIKGDHIEPIFYNQILRRFMSKNEVNLVIQVNDIEFTFKNSKNGIHQLSMMLESGQLVGIIGRSGVGKSTLLNLLNGSRKPQKGSITINNIDLYRNNKKLEGIIGYVPQDDLLIEDLSVFTNLYINAQLCFDNLSHDSLMEKVNNLLLEMNLYEVRNLKVGTPLNKFISGGQRKKLNIALELIREPLIMFADEPTSGLSSSDSEEIMQHLTEQTLNGRIVLVNIHQPSSDIFKLFDKIIVLDKEGYPVFFGNPMDIIPYFNEFNQRHTTVTERCSVCGNINPETIFKVLEEKQVNELGEYTNVRKLSPHQWHDYFLKNIPEKKLESSGELPEKPLHKPNLCTQFLIFSKRNLLSKIANRSYLMLALFISPMLSALLAFLCKSGSSPNATGYVFGFNDNIPPFLFMSVIVALFIGLIISAEEIIRDRKILFRESYLKLSRKSYLASKVAYLFALSALQTFLYVIISNHILGIREMTLNFWMILFSTSCFANLLGLLISSVFSSVVVIYIVVPLLIVPQILLSGIVVNFDKLNNKVTSERFVPLVGDMMASRWAYEALLVSQFKYNAYQRYYFETEKKISNAQFNILFLIPEVKSALNEIKDYSDIKLYKEKLEFIRNVLSDLNNYLSGLPAHELSKDTFTRDDLSRTDQYLSRVNTVTLTEINLLSHQKDSITHQLLSITGSNLKFLEFKNHNYNNSVAEMLLKRRSLEPYRKVKKEIIRELEPVYQLPSSNYGRAQFLASSKTVGNFEFDTLIFNTLALWIMSLILLVSLYLIFSLHRNS